MQTHSTTKDHSEKVAKSPLPSDEATAYAVAVTKGKIVAGPHVRAACKRHLDDLRDAHKRGLWFDLEAVDRIIGYFKNVLRLSEGQFEGIPFIPDPSQAFILGSIFGWKREDGTRRFRRAYIEQGKGNGKSPLIGGIGLYGLASDDEAGAEIYSAGSKKDQALVLFRDACKMRQKSASLSKRIQVSGGDHPWNLFHVPSGSFFRPVSRESGKSGSGPRPHFALCDEVHEHPNRSVMEMLERGFKFRRQPLLLMITNSGTDRNSVCWEEHVHAIKVAHRDIEDDTTFSYVCALDDDDDPLEDPSCWIKANPLLGKILSYEYLKGVVDQAKAIPGKLNGILRLHFCTWTDSDKAWLPRTAWEGCEDPNMKMEDFKGKSCVVGLDLSATNDLTGMSFVFEDGKTDDGRPKFALFSLGYTPKDTINARVLRDRTPYDLWVRDGFLKALPGKKIRLDYVAHDLVEFSRIYNITNVSYDQWMFRDFEAELTALGAEIPLVEHPQGINRRKESPLWMPDSIEHLEKLIYEGRLRVQVNLALRSSVASASFWSSAAGLRRFDKKKATNKIDLLVASVMAIGAACTIQPEPEYSVVII